MCGKNQPYENYQLDVPMMSLFLSDKDKKTLEKVSKKMQLASQNLEFELAARLYYQLIDLHVIQ
ncbi:UvrB/UvrC motif-containing protein [Candidatus Vesicomyidisocius calyptogenae]|uniref:UvrB/UvrC motif-containing protein n=1 Tax=Vesicomyosocius okutanii subsp. Calyptogena okutanii (strain HA) TaxID=412965 RepID=UPI0002F20959|nr:UvrB/UvrC motif-containing protein [Candidatus Vesicomyosocius okutanii]